MMTSSMVALARIVSGAHARWQGCAPGKRQRIYFANHTSHLDALVLWSVLPPELRELTRPVAAADYWRAGRLRQHVAERVFHAVLIERKRPTAKDNPLDKMLEALDRGNSLILFPEGTRNTEPVPGAFKGGLFHLARKRPDVELIPVLLDNLNRILPKGEFLPVPLLGSVTFGAPLRLDQGEEKAAFLERARNAIIKLHKT